MKAGLEVAPSCGAGGALTEVLGDAGVRLAPLPASRRSGCSTACAAAVCSPGTAARRRPTWPRVAEVVERVAALAVAHPEVAELDLNPVVASPGGAMVLDARIRVHPVDPGPPDPSVQGDWP